MQTLTSPLQYSTLVPAHITTKGTRYMRTQSMDTHPDIERVQIELIRKAPITKRFAIMQAWSQFIIEATKQVIRREHPGMSEQEISLLLLERQYGAELAGKVRAYLARRNKDGRESNSNC